MPKTEVISGPIDSIANLTDIFATQDEVVQKIVTALAVKLTRREEQRLRRRGTSNVEAYDFWWRARELLGKGTREATFASPRHASKSDRDRSDILRPRMPDWLSSAISDYINGWTPDPEQALDEAERRARRAIELDDQEPVGHMALGSVLLWQRKHDDALTELKRVLEVDPNYAQGYAINAMTLMYSGRAAEVARAVCHRHAARPPLFQHAPAYSRASAFQSRSI